MINGKIKEGDMPWNLKKKYIYIYIETISICNNGTLAYFLEVQLRGSHFLESRYGLKSASKVKAIFVVVGKFTGKSRLEWFDPRCPSYEDVGYIIIEPHP